MSSDKPLPFIYQFGAGAVAGVSEVRSTLNWPLNIDTKSKYHLDFGDVLYHNFGDCAGV